MSDLIVCFSYKLSLNSFCLTVYLRSFANQLPFLAWYIFLEYFFHKMKLKHTFRVDCSLRHIPVLLFWKIITHWISTCCWLVSLRWDYNGCSNRSDRLIVWSFVWLSVYYSPQTSCHFYFDIAPIVSNNLLPFNIFSLKSAGKKWEYSACVF